MNASLWRTAAEPADPPDEYDLMLRHRDRVRETIRDEFRGLPYVDPLDLPFLRDANLHPSLVRDVLCIYATEEAVSGRLP